MAISRFKTSTVAQGLPKYTEIWDQTTFAGPPVSGYKLWLDASDTASITASGGAVSQWSDKSGNARHLTQGTGANQPTTGTRTINGKNVIDFDGTNDWMSVPSSTALFNYLHNSTGGTTFVVGIVDNTAAGKTIFGTCDFSSADTGVVSDVNSSEQTNLAIVRGASGASTAIAFAVNTLTAGSAFYLTAKFDGGNATAGNRLRESLNNCAFAGANSLTNTASTSNSTGNMTVGANHNGNTNWDGVIGEIIIYEGILSDANIDSVEAYLAAKWGI